MKVNIYIIIEEKEEKLFLMIKMNMNMKEIIYLIQNGMERYMIKIEK